MNIEAQGGELVLKNQSGDYAIIPASQRDLVMTLIEQQCYSCVDELVKTLPAKNDYAQDGTVVSELYTRITGKPWHTAKQEGLTTGSYADNMALRKKLMEGEFSPSYIKDIQTKLEGHEADDLMKYNTPLSADEQTAFLSWAEAESKRKNRNILMDLGTYDLQGLWKSGEYKNEDNRGHNTDKYKKPNHPTFSDQSIYKDYGSPGKWTDDGGWMPSQVQKKIYPSQYYEQLFADEPEYLTKDFNTAFSEARKKLGPNRLFEFDKDGDGIPEFYGTNIAGETLNPPAEDLKKYKAANLKQHLQAQNKQVESEYSSKQTVKLQPTWKDWDEISQQREELEKMENADRIIHTYKNSDEKYLIVDEKNARLHLYQGPNKIDSFEVLVGKESGDAQTVTYINPETKKVEWDKGNKSTGAGIYEISVVNPSNKTYSNAPSFNIVNQQGVEVSTAIHAMPKGLGRKFGTDDPKQTYGCINAQCSDLKDLYSKYKINKGTKVYILPEDPGNEFTVIDGKPVFKASFENRKAATQPVNELVKGQGINVTPQSKITEYKPVRISVDYKEFKEVFNKDWDFDDKREFNQTVIPYIQTLQDSKKQIMDLTKISSDAYNDLAKTAIGILGVESHFGDTNIIPVDAVKAFAKMVDPVGKGGPDYKDKEFYQKIRDAKEAFTEAVKTKFKYGYWDYDYQFDKDNSSVGLTQLRWRWTTDQERQNLEKVGITGSDDFKDPQKAALGTMILLATRYRNQSPDKRNLASLWGNVRENYQDRVNFNSQPFKIEQLDY